MPRRSARIAYVAAIAALFTSGPALGSSHEMFLGFNHDGDLGTIDPISLEWADTVTVIIEVVDQPIGQGVDISLAFGTAVCDTFYGGYSHEYCGVVFGIPEEYFGDDWCNRELLDQCDFILGVGIGCEPPWLHFRVGPGVVLEPGQRYALCRLMAERSWRPCEHWAEAGFECGGYGVTNRIWLEPGMASVPDDPALPEKPDEPTTWSQIKRQFR